MWYQDYFTNYSRSFYQLETHSIPGIHYVMTHKDEELYTAVVVKIQELLPQLQTTSTMSD